MAEKAEKFESPEEEIRHLEQKLEEKKRELASSGAEAPGEKEIFREVLKEHIDERKPAEAPGLPLLPGVSHFPADDIRKKADDIKKIEAEEEKVRGLVEFALTRSIEDALKVAQESTPYLIDQLHDHLVDDYYDKLVALRKIKSL